MNERPQAPGSERYHSSAWFARTGSREWSGSRTRSGCDGRWGLQAGGHPHNVDRHRRPSTPRSGRSSSCSSAGLGPIHPSSRTSCSTHVVSQQVRKAAGGFPLPPGADLPVAKDHDGLIPTPIGSLKYSVRFTVGLKNAGTRPHKSKANVPNRRNGRSWRSSCRPPVGGSAVGAIGVLTASLNGGSMSFALATSETIRLGSPRVQRKTATACGAGHC